MSAILGNAQNNNLFNALNLSQIRNFGIIAHIDHGKSTLTDRFIQLVYKDSEKQLFEKERLTDVLEIEQERGITIKLQPVTLFWKGFLLNLIDTPGHVDFAYEVSRSLKASEGAILLIDVTQGVQAQTISTLLSAMEHNLEIIPVLNKVDIALKSLIQQRLDEIKSILGFSQEEVILASGKTGQGVEQILDAVIQKIPAPKTLKDVLNTKNIFGNNKKDLNVGKNKTDITSIKTSTAHSEDSHLAALIFDSFYNPHKGVVASVRIFSGTVKRDQEVYLANVGEKFLVREVGIFTPELQPVKSLRPGMVGYIATGIKDIKSVRIGDTITSNVKIKIPGFKRPKAKVFASVYPANKEDYLQLKEALEKLALNDASLDIKQDYSVVLGQGFRIGFLGLLHLEITRERLQREFEVDTVITMPSVQYKVVLKNGEQIIVKGAYEMPEKPDIKQVYEPVILGDIMVPSEYVSNIYNLVRESRGIVLETQNLYSSRVQNIVYYLVKVKLPYAELIKGFFNKLKAVSKGYASLQYQKIVYEPVDLVKVDILVNKEIVPSLSFLEVPEKARERAKKILAILKQNLDRQMFPVPLQGAIGSKIIARETIPAYKKNVTAKLYGGDITRKMKLWHNQAKKKKLRAGYARVNIPHKAFVKIMQDT